MTDSPASPGASSPLGPATQKSDAPPTLSTDDPSASKSFPGSPDQAQQGQVSYSNNVAANADVDFDMGDDPSGELPLGDPAPGDASILDQDTSIHEAIEPEHTQQQQQQQQQESSSTPLPGHGPTPSRKDASLKEFLNQMDDYAPIVYFYFSFPPSLSPLFFSRSSLLTVS